jgi:hypothetical protein
MEKLVKSNTPWETYLVDGRNVIVKREDLCCPFPGPSFSKIRGVAKKIDNLNQMLIKPEAVGVVDTRHSKAGWGVSYIAQKRNIPCVVYYPRFKDEGDRLRPFQQKCQEFGARLVALPATMSAVLFNQAKKMFQKEHTNGYIFPNGLKLTETVKETTEELIRTFPEELWDSKAWIIVSISSGTIGAGVMRGLAEIGFRGTVLIHQGYSRPIYAVNRYLKKMAGVQNPPFRYTIIDEKYQYKDTAGKISIPFPCNPYYDAKAWKWLTEHIQEIPKESPIVFWNIGS